MKLYAKIESERAQEAQGGNEYISCVVVGEDRKTVLLDFYVAPADDDTRVIFKVKGYQAQEYVIKGEQKKDEQAQA